MNYDEPKEFKIYWSECLDCGWEDVDSYLNEEDANCFNFCPDCDSDYLNIDFEWSV